MWQEIAIIIIGALAFVYAGWKAYRLFASPDDASPCCGCRLHCALRTSKKRRRVAVEKNAAKSACVN
jgi:hypothetical protein